MALLDVKDAQRVEAAIAEAEASSAGELVVAVVGRSDRYDLPRGAIAISATLAAMVAAHALWPQVDASVLLLGQLGSWTLLWWLCGQPWLLRRLVGRPHVVHAVERRAQRMFMEQGIYRTRDASGLLIMISELERRVVILGDRGIDARIGQKGWATYVNTIVQGIRGGATADALVQVLHELRDVLAVHFPPRPDDVNELPNRIVIAPS